MTRESAAAAYIRVRPPPYRARARSCDLLVQWRLPLDAFAHALALAARAKAKGAVAAVGTDEATAESPLSWISELAHTLFGRAGRSETVQRRDSFVDPAIKMYKM